MQEGPDSSKSSGCKAREKRKAEVYQDIHEDLRFLRQRRRRCFFNCLAAKALGVTQKTFSALLNGRSGVSPEMALRLSKVFGRTPEGWLRLQIQYDLWKTSQSVDLGDLKKIEAM